MTKSKKKMPDGAKCVVVLAVLCLVISAALAFTNQMTYPVITEGATERAEQARVEALPQAEGFELMEGLDGVPASVTEIYRSTNDVGYVFMITVKGYGGDMKLICSIDNDGKIVSCKTLSHNETAGLGSKTAEDAYKNQYIGQDSSLSGVQAISGATISSNAYKGGIQDAFTAYEIAKEAGK